MWRWRNHHSLACFAASEPGKLSTIDRKMNSHVYQDILMENVRWFVSAQQTLGRYNKTMTQSTGEIQQQNSFNRWKHSFYSSPESWPQPDWDGLAWPQESNSHQTSQEYCRAGTVLFRGVVQNSSWPLSRIDLQLQEVLVSLAMSVQWLPETAEQLFATSFQNLQAKKIE